MAGKREKGKLSYLIILAILLVMVSSRYFEFSSGTFEYLSSYLTYPFLSIQNKISKSISNYAQNKKSYSDLLDNFLKSSHENQNLRSEIIKLESSLSYLSQIDELVSFTKRYENSNYVLAQVILKNFTEKSHHFLVNVGSNQGISVDMAVIYKNFLVGKVVEVYPNLSKVLLITDKNCKVAALIPRSQAKGINTGLNDTWFTSLNFVSHLENVLENDLIITSGQGLVFPQGFGLGKVEHCALDGLFYKITVKLEIDLSKLDYVYINKNNLDIN